MSSHSQVRHIAMVCHEANRAYCLSLGESVGSWQRIESGERDGIIERVQEYINNPVPNVVVENPDEQMKRALKKYDLFCAIVDALK